MPASATVCGLVVALLVSIRVPVSLPKLEGVNVTVMLQLFPTPSVLGLSGQFPPETKTPELAPLTVMPLIVSGTDWVFLNVTVFGALVCLMK